MKEKCLRPTREYSWPESLIRQSWLDLDCIISTLKRKVLTQNCVKNLVLKIIKNYNGNIDISSVTNNKKFWKAVKLHLSNKISLNILSDYQVIAETFSNYFTDIVQILLTLTNKNYHKKKTNDFNLNLLDPEEAPISKYKNHPSVHAIRGTRQNYIIQFLNLSIHP